MSRNKDTTVELVTTAAATPAWHAEYAQSTYDLLASREEGLVASEVAVKREKYGENRLSKYKAPSLFSRFVAQLSSPLTLVLVGAFLITFSLQEFVDASVIAIALLIAVIVGLIQEGRASNAFSKLAHSQPHIAHVRREGKRFEIDSVELVPGDIVYLQAGMQVPADVRLCKVKNLSINESPLTGEWVAVKKDVDIVDVGTPLTERTNMAWMGTLVATGSGLGIVVATGKNTSIGELAEDLKGIVDEKTPLQKEMQKVSKYMLYLILFLITLIFVVGLIQGQSIHDMLLISIAMAVAAVPEGLPAALTIILAVGMDSLLKRGGLVKNLLAAETLGSTTFVLTDKTGTLTEGKMSVSGLIIDEERLGLKQIAQAETPVLMLLKTAVAATDAFFDERSETLRGDPVETAIVRVADNVGISMRKGLIQQSRLDYLPFESELRFAAGLVPDAGTYKLCINGAPGILLAASTEYVRGAGTVATLDEEKRKCIEQVIAKETEQGHRLIAVAYKEVLYTDIPDNGANVAEKLVFAGLVILSDPARVGVSRAIAGVENAGARVILVTGDNPATALAIAKEVGISMKHDRALSGVEISKYSDAELLAAIDSGISVFARVLPQQKLRITTLLQKRGEVVAMTGDGINDSLALQKANIGIAIGSGTEVAKEASDLVLVNDSFEIIYAAIEEGRRIVSNLKKVVGYLLSTSLSEVVLIGAALAVGAPVPLTAAQILWANIIEEGFMSVAFAFEKGDKGLMQQRPEAVHKNGILAKETLAFILFCSTVLSGLSLGLYFYIKSLGVPFEELRSVMFLSISIDSLFIAFAFRSLQTPVWNIPLSTNKFFLGSFLVSASLLAIVISVPFFQTFLSYQPLPLRDILLVIGVSLASLLTIEFGKTIFFRPKK